MNNKLFTALFFSALAHVILIVGLTFINSNFFESNIEAELTRPNWSRHILQVGVLVLSKPKPLTIQNKLEPIVQGENKERTFAQLETSQKMQSEPEVTAAGLPITEVATNTSNAGAKLTDKHYYKPSEVDMGAIPMHGIELSTMTSESKLLEVYQLRVFINKSGIVDLIVDLNADSVPQLFYSQVEMQVKKLTFIPAKKNGVEVDSYIDVALER